MLIAEELFLLLRRDDGKWESSYSHNGVGLAAAVLIDLCLADKVALSNDKDPRVSVPDNAPVGDPVLDAALVRLRAKEGTKLSSLITDGKLNPEQLVAAGLAKARVIRIEDRRARGLIPAKYPILDPAPEARIRDRLRATLAGSTPTIADSSLLVILHGLALAAKVLSEEKGTLSGKELKQRIAEVQGESAIGVTAARTLQATDGAITRAMLSRMTATGG